ncbi:LapA family protein [Nocardiopsis sp. LOL_012]|uniref:LapA family protein n=1 Tax=Nocardiopsis sp. LOL_012 TaxID=3345409 RepID=UPI003A86A58A
MDSRTPPDGTAAGAGAPAKRFSLGSIPTRLWVALILLILAVIFVAQNRDAVQIQVLVVSLSAPLWATLGGAVLVGLVIGLLLRPSARKQRKAAQR